jgi:hypothetical protein
MKKATEKKFCEGNQRKGNKKGKRNLPGEPNSGSQKYGSTNTDTMRGGITRIDDNPSAKPSQGTRKQLGTTPNLSQGHRNHVTCKANATFDP